MHSASVTQIINGLKSRHDETRSQAARELRRYVSSELQEVSREEVSKFLDEFNEFLGEMVSSSEVNEKKGAILAIGKGVVG